MKPFAPSDTQPVAPCSSVIVERRLDELKPWPGNPRTHSEKQLVKLKASIRKFGFTAPVLIDEADFILSGHGRVDAARELDLSTVPTRLIAGLTQTQKRAYVIADNSREPGYVLVVQRPANSRPSARPAVPWGRGDTRAEAPSVSVRPAPPFPDSHAT